MPRCCGPAGDATEGDVKSYEYCTLDVFTDRRFGGNPLAVVLDARRYR